MFEILCGAQSKIREKKYHFSFIGGKNKETACREAADIIASKAADGILLHGSATSRSLTALLSDTAFPHVIIGRPPFPNTTCWIDTNNHVSGEMAAKYLMP